MPTPGQLLMEQHVKILGILYIVIGGLGVAAALIVFGIFGGIAGSVTRSSVQSRFIMSRFSRKRDTRPSGESP